MRDVQPKTIGRAMGKPGSLASHSPDRHGAQQEHRYRLAQDPANLTLKHGVPWLGKALEWPMPPFFRSRDLPGEDLPHWSLLSAGHVQSP